MTNGDSTLRFSEPLNPGDDAMVQQMLASGSVISREWPDNQHLMNDEGIEQTVLEQIGEPREDNLEPGTSYVLWTSGHVAKVQPERDHIIGTVRAHGVSSGCDICNKSGDDPVGIAVVAVPRNLVALVFCGLCASAYQPDLIEGATQ